MENFRQSMRQSMDPSTPEGTLCRKVLTGTQLLLSCRWVAVAWQLYAIVPLPLVYGIALLPSLVFTGVILPVLCGGADLCGCCRRNGSGSGRGVAALSVACMLVELCLSCVLSYGLFKVGDLLASNPDGTLNIYWSGTLHSFIFSVVGTALSFLVHVALAVQGHCCAKPDRSVAGEGDRCRAAGLAIEMASSEGSSAGGGSPLRESLTGGSGVDLFDNPPPKAGCCAGGVKGMASRILALSDEEKVVCAVLMIYVMVLATQLTTFFWGVVQWASLTGPLTHTGKGAPVCGDPLVGNYAPCALPFPSSYILEPDPPSATGYRVAMTSESLPLSRWDGALSPAAWNAQDGFSTVSPVLFAFAKAPIDPATLISHEEIDRSVDTTNMHDMTTILLDAETGELVPHWVDLDQYHIKFGDADDGRPPLLILQPAQPLKHNTRYIVAVKGLTTTSGGAAVPAEPAFSAVRDCVPPGCSPTQRLSQLSPPIAWPDARTVEYNSFVFPKLAAAGFGPRSYIQLAWWYKTVSIESSLGVAKHIRDQSLAAVPLHPAAGKILPVIDSVKEYSCKPGDTKGSDGSWGGSDGVHIGRTVWGHFMAPSYLRRAGPGPQTFYNYPYDKTKEMADSLDPADHSRGGPWWGRVNTDLGAGSGARSSGEGVRPMPVLNDEQEKVGWVARIPCSVLADTAHYTPGAGNAPNNGPDNANGSPMPFLLQYGHGLFGSRDEINSGFLSKLADENKWILVALDWAGMAQYDVPQAIRIMASRLDEFASMPQRTVQGWAFDAMLMRLMGTAAMANLDAFKSPTTGSPMISALQYAAGASSATVAIQTGDINVPGPLTAGYYGNSQGSVVGCGYCAYQQDIRRCTCGVPGSPFALILSRSADFVPYYDALKLQMTHAQDIRLAIVLMQVLWDQGESAGWLREMAPKGVLLQAGIGDAQVSNLGAELMARAYNASFVQPQTRAVYGISEKTAPFHGSALVEWLYDDVPDSPAGDFGRSDGKDVHECPRREPAAQRQMREFLEGREVTQQCRGPTLPNTAVVCESESCPSDYGPWPNSPTAIPPGGSGR